MKPSKIDFYLKKKKKCWKNLESPTVIVDSSIFIDHPSKSPRLESLHTVVVDSSIPQDHPLKSPQPNIEEDGSISIERDPEKHKHIWDYPVEQRDEIRCAYGELLSTRLHDIWERSSKNRTSTL